MNGALTDDELPDELFEQGPGPLRIVRLADVKPEEIDWLWRGRIARGKVTMIVGDPGDGKSFLSMAVAAAVTQGRALPDGDAMHAGDVVLWNGEDGLADTIRVRAERVGADLERLHVIEGAGGPDGQQVAFGLQHVPELCAEIERRGNVSLAIIDPISALLAGVDAHRDAEVRSALQPLADLAHRTGVALCVVAHLNKANAGRSIYRVGGSIGFVGLARSVLLVAREQESGRRAIASLKSNMGAEVLPVEFRIDDEGFWWGGTAEDLSANRMLAPDSGERSALDDAARGIIETLEHAGGEMRGRDLDQAMRDAGVKKVTYERARAVLVKDNKIERRGGNRYQKELRWTLGSTVHHMVTELPEMTETKNMTETRSSLNHTTYSQSSNSSLVHISAFARDKTSMNESSFQGKLCGICKRIGTCTNEGPEGFTCRECRG